MKKQLHIKKGQESNRISILKELMRDLDLFEEIKVTPTGFWDHGRRTVAKGDFKITLIIEEDNN